MHCFALTLTCLDSFAHKTLMEVLERRHVTFANADVISPSRKYHHHRINSKTAPIQLPNGEDVLRNDADDDYNNSSATYPRLRAATDGAPILIPSRPNLASRSLSLGRSRHQIASLQIPPSLERKVSSSDAVEVGEFNTDHHAHQDGAFPPKLSSSSTNKHRRIRSAVPAGFHHRGGLGTGIVPAALNTPGERAKFVALSMKAKIVDTFDEPNIRSVSDNDFPDLMGVLEAQRHQNEYASNNGSQHRSGGGGGGTSQKSLDEEVGRCGTGGSRYSSGPLSSENETGRGKHNNRKWKHRPFSGISSSPFFSNYGGTSNVDQLFQVVENVQELCKIPENEETATHDDVSSATAKSDALAEENAKFLSRLSSYPVVPPIYVEAEDNASADEQTPLVEPSSSASQQLKNKLSPRRGLRSFASFTYPKTPGSRSHTFCVWWTELCKQMKMLAVAFDGAYVKERLWSSLLNDVSMFIIPLLSLSAFFFYQLNNPILPFLSTDASISWWILFIIRHYVTLLVSNTC